MTIGWPLYILLLYVDGIQDGQHISTKFNMEHYWKYVLEIYFFVTTKKHGCNVSPLQQCTLVVSRIIDCSLLNTT